MKNPKQIIAYLEQKSKNWNEEAVACAKKFIEHPDQTQHRERARRLFENIDYNKSLIKFIKIGEEK